MGGFDRRLTVGLLIVQTLVSLFAILAIVFTSALSGACGSDHFGGETCNSTASVIDYVIVTGCWVVLIASAAVVALRVARNRIAWPVAAVALGVVALLSVSCWSLLSAASAGQPYDPLP